MKKIREIHGVAGLTRGSGPGNGNENLYVADGTATVVVHLSAGPLNLAPEEARALAKMLTDSAERVEKGQS